MAKKNKKDLRQRRHQRLRTALRGTAERPRLAVCRTLKHIHVQLIDDDRGHTIAAVSTVESAQRAANVKANVAGAKRLGALLGEKAKAAGVGAVVFDRGGFRYHGCIKAVADGAREAGLQF